MSRTLRALLIAGLAVGILVGGIVAIAVPRTQGRGSAGPAAASPPQVDPVRVGPERPQSKGGAGVQLRVHPDSIRLEARTPDPRGGPAWALRVFEAERVVPHGARRPGVDPVIGRDLCVQLGRLYRGRFGWLDAQAVFRPVGLGFRGAPTRCGSRRPDMGRNPIVGLESLITNPSSSAPRVHRTVLWGLAGPAVRSATARLAGRAVDVKVSPRGGLLLLASGALHEPQVAVRLRYASGRPKDVQLGRFRAPPILGRQLHGGPVGPAHVQARAPDPNGGPAWGVAAARSSDGGWCVTQAARVVGDRVGSVDTALGTMHETVPNRFACPSNRAPLTRGQPLDLGSQFGGGDTRAGPQRTARRTLPGRTVLGGAARDDVKSITIATPRDVRTLLPSGPAHAFVAVYDGTFPTGETIITVTFTDGTTHEQRLPSSAF